MKGLKFLVVFFFVIASANMNAGAPPPPSTGDPGCWPPPCIPIDGGISLLIAAGVALGAKKFYDSRKSTETPS